jgi:AcrR family transcriptional regulator/catechol 2,3-dioxygenase-like lactoylglutathione lyase family enzyme
MTEPRTGRPKLSSKDTIAEAACELFLERGYDATSIVDISLRAGVSRSSFFNYFSSKSDILWSGFDMRVAALEQRLAAIRSVPAELLAALRGFAADFAPDALALALANAPAMGLEAELERESAVRMSRIGRAIARSWRLEHGALEAETLGAAFGGAVLAAVHEWARSHPGQTPLADILDDALDVVASLLREPGPVRQLRLVVETADLDEALAVYRDALGMPQAAAYEAEGGARVAILEAGRATLELANAEQVRFIDRVETEGGRSDPLRVALEVRDAEAATTVLSAAGARVEASMRETPWRSRNARLRGPDGVQLTVFEELDRS